MNIYSHREVYPDDLVVICQFPQNKEELYFMFPKATFPLTVNQLQNAVENRTDSSVVLYNKVVVGFANFYETEINQYCSIGNVIINPQYRGKGATKYLIGIMERIAIEKYNATEIHISCFNQNVVGLLLYSNLGYTPYEIEKRLDKGSKPVALIKMKREIYKP